MKKIIFLIFMIFLFCPNVYAAEFNMNSYTSATNNGTKNRYRATEIYNTGTSSVYTFGTRYNGRISDIETYFDYPFESNTTYRLTYNMATDDFRNNFDGGYWWDCDDSTQINPYRSSVSYISYKKIQISFKPTANTTCIRMWVRSTNLSSTAITGVSNWSLTNITLYDPDWQTGTGSGQGTSTPAPSNSNNNTQDIINNQNENTQDIIENNNNNTQDIINSQDDNALNELNATRSNAVSNCSNAFPVNFYKGYYISENDVLVSDSNSYYTDYIYLGTGISQITITNSVNVATPNRYFIFYDVNKTKISYTYTSNRVNTIPSGAVYFRLSTNQSALQVFKGGDGCIDRTTSALTDDNISSGVGSDFFDNFTNNMHGLSSIITLPLSTIQSLTNSQCTPLTLPIPFTEKNITLPCMTEIYQQHVPVLLTLLRTCWLGIISYMVLVDIFAMVKGFKDPDSDKIEVMEL